MNVKTEENNRPIFEKKFRKLIYDPNSQDLIRNALNLGYVMGCGACEVIPLCIATTIILSTALEKSLRESPKPSKYGYDMSLPHPFMLLYKVETKGRGRCKQQHYEIRSQIIPTSLMKSVKRNINFQTEAAAHHLYITEQSEDLQYKEMRTKASALASLIKCYKWENKTLPLEREDFLNVIDYAKNESLGFHGISNVINLIKKTNKHYKT
eukprot:CAMPEP_0113516808 /NCGR_PEP_ID=MMETSP0014_2-20120614/41826_1 /TAXON_ID=2857 /ORGANISM="Nitzschia sp." /LENGTH=209 /DNA_ID=CAMNT_0000413769 /DNA_START=386 /DNA_END=1012 /DNA_ORIENTATION=+ /assembly_acc=CAM_ASM_000159